MSRREVTVKLATAQRDAVMKFLDKHKELGYSSFADFVTDAVREKFTELTQQLQDKEEKVPMAEE